MPRWRRPGVVLNFHEPLAEPSKVEPLCPLLALSGLFERLAARPLLGLRRTLPCNGSADAFMSTWPNCRRLDELPPWRNGE